MWIVRHLVLFIDTNMGVHRKYVSFYSHSSFFIVTNFEIWIYIEIMWIIRHLVLFIATNMGIHRKYVSYYSHSSFFIVTNFEIWVYKGIKIHFLLVTLKLS